MTKSTNRFVAIARENWQPIAAMLAAFVVYYCMYACRKPWAAASWEGNLLSSDITLKVALSVSQVIGYALAKFIGAPVCSAIPYRRIPYTLIGCIVCALLALFALPYMGEFKFVAMFFNGLSLGMVWGFVMRPLEGRKLTEMLIAGLCVSFIIASGDVKAMGKWLMTTEFFAERFGANEAWMPFVTGLIYFPFLVLATIALFCLPQPTKEDQELRSQRKSMSFADQREFLKNHWMVLIPLSIAYFFLTAYRDFRDTFQNEIFTTLGITDASAFSTTERYVAFGVIVVLSIFIFIKQSRLALIACHLVMAFGLIFCGVVTWLHGAGRLGEMMANVDNFLPTMGEQEMDKMALEGYWWMVLAGLGAYICYIAFHCIVFERLVAYTRAPGNAVFAMMVFDFVGYVAAILFMLLKDFLFGDVNHFDSLVWLTWVLMFGGGGAIFFSLLMMPKLKVFDSQP